MTRSKHGQEQSEEEKESVKLLCEYFREKTGKIIGYEKIEKDPPDYYLIENKTKIAFVECTDIVSKEIGKNKKELRFRSQLEKELNNQDYGIENKLIIIILGFSDNYKFFNKQKDNELIFQIKSWFVNCLENNESTILHLDKKQLRLELEIIKLPYHEKTSFSVVPEGKAEWLISYTKAFINEIIQCIEEKNLRLAGSSAYEHILLIHTKDNFIDIDYIKNSLAKNKELRSKISNIDKVYIIPWGSSRKIQLLYEKTEQKPPKN